MKALIFNGALERKSQSTSAALSTYIAEQLTELGITTRTFNLVDSGIPLFDVSLTRTPKGVEVMNQYFQEADIHFWLAPLYHGGIPGVMKNCLDWLELSAKSTPPYLTNKTIGLVCWADGVQAMQGINNMDAIAKALRAWPLPLSVPIIRPQLFEANKNYEITPQYQHKLNLLISLATQSYIGKR